MSSNRVGESPTHSDRSAIVHALLEVHAMFEVHAVFDVHAMFEVHALFEVHAMFEVHAYSSPRVFHLHARVAFFLKNHAY